MLRAAQNIKQRPATLEPLGFARDCPPGLAMACSLKDSLQGLRGLASPDPTNQLPTSLIGQATRPPGGSTAYFLPTAHLQLSKSSTGHSPLQLADRLSRVHLVATSRE